MVAPAVETAKAALVMRLSASASAVACCAVRVMSGIPASVSAMPARCLSAINAVTEALPDGAWVQRMEWNGQTLRLVGFKRSDIDLSAAIRGTGLFTNPRAAGPETTPGPTAVRPFDITADARPEPRP